MNNKPIKISKNVYIISSASVVGKKEKNGPLGHLFDLGGDDKFGKNTWEKSEAEMQRLALGIALNKSGFTVDSIDYLFAGDLINQCISSSYGLADYRIPFLGLYGACSTCAEGMMMSSVYASLYSTRCAAVTSSHYCSAERQFRYPLEYGGQRPPTAQWTVTGSGAFIYTSLTNDIARCNSEFIPTIVDFMPGCVVDKGLNDANNMGAAMAPAASDTLERYFSSGQSTDQFDMILTGDLGREGSEILKDILLSKKIDITSNHVDCGNMIYNAESSDTHAGGSGCGCSAVVMAANIIENIKLGILRNVLFIGTGALMNTMAINQKQTIPGIAHLVHIKAVKKNEIDTRETDQKNECIT